MPVVLLIIGVVLWLTADSAHAETAAEKAFGRWERVTPETMTRPVPESSYSASLGAVTNEYRKHGPAGPARALPLSLPVAPEQVAGLTQPPERR